MNAQTQIATPIITLTGSAALLLEMRGNADEARDESLPGYDDVTLFFTWHFDRDNRYFCPNTNLLGVLLYGNDTGEIEAVIARAEAVARFGHALVAGLENDSAERAA